MVRLLAHLPNMDLNRGDIFHASPLAHAVQRDRWDLAEILVEAGANLNIQTGGEGDTPLHVAAAKGDAKRVRWLLDRGADPGLKNFRQLVPQDVCAPGEALEVLKNHSARMKAP